MRVLTKDYADREAFEADHAQSLSQGGVLVESDEVPQSREKVEVVLTLAKKHPVRIEAVVVYCAPGRPNSVGLEFVGDWKKALVTLEQAGAGDEKGEIWGKDSESVFHRISKMTVTEKVQLAVRAGREERRILMKDAHHQAHVYLLKNPKITSDEVAQMCKSHNITPEMLIDISHNLDWMRNGTIRMSVIKNPKTPSTVVKKHVQTLNDHELYQLARSDSVRESVSRMARSVLAQKGKRVE